MTLAADTYYHRKTNIVWVIVLLAILFGLFLIAMLFGDPSKTGAGVRVLGMIAGFSLPAIIAAFGWVLWRKPRALVVSEAGIDIPFAFKRPLRWDEIHRIRRVREGARMLGKRDWLIVDPLPGVLAPLRLPVWRRLELWFQSRHGVRIPLHGLEGDPETIVRSVERFRPVRLDDL